MTDAYAVVVAVAVALHFAFLGYGVAGGFLALRRPKTIWLHVAVVIYCLAIEVVDFVCPLTALERWGRAGAGMAPLPPTGFIDDYLTGVWYPAEAEHLVLASVIVVVLASWILVARQARRRGRAGRQPVGMSSNCS